MTDLIAKSLIAGNKDKRKLIDAMARIKELEAIIARMKNKLS